jgi:hypothetical protein
MFRCSLTADEIEKCKWLAELKTAECAEGKMQHKRVGNRTTPDTYTNHLQGALGEQALAKFLDVDYGFMPFDRANYDVAGYEVRSTRRQTGRLLTHHDDKPALYVLAIIEADNIIRLHGWRHLKEINTPKHWDSTLPHPCYATPQTELWPMDMLPATALYLCAKTN